MCQSHTGHMTGLWFMPARPLRLNTNEWMIWCDMMYGIWCNVMWCDMIYIIWYDMIWYMIWYVIYLLQLDFYPVSLVGRLVQKYERDSCMYKRRHNTQNNKKTQNRQNRKQNIQNKNTDIKRILKIIIRVIIKWQIAANNNDTTYCTEHTCSYVTINKITNSSK